MSPLDNPIEGAHIVIADAVVLTTATAALGFTDIDISATIGTRKALCVFKFKQTTADDLNQFVFRQNGEADSYVLVAQHQGGSAGGYVSAADEFQYAICHTDANGIVEYKAANNQDIEVTLVAYIYED